MLRDATAAVELSEIADSSEPLSRRAEAMLGALRRVVPFDAAWLALAEPHGRRYMTLATVGVADSTAIYLAGPKHVHDIELAGTVRAARPLTPGDLPYPAEELETWAQCLIPAGIHNGFAMGLFASDSRPVGFLALMSGSREAPTEQVRRSLGRLTTVLGRGIDPMRTFSAAASLVKGASAGAVLHENGWIELLPGFRPLELLAAGSPAVAAARAAIEGGQLYASFLWPLGGRHAPGGHVRITVLGPSEDVPAFLTGMVLASPAGNLHGLTPRELEVLGLLIDGLSNAAIARALVVASRTVAAHVEHILDKLSAPSRTLAAVRARREGLYVPRRPRRRPPGPGEGIDPR
jgi:DNA-binding CsgD family transcriptional regulator